MRGMMWGREGVETALLGGRRAVVFFLSPLKHPPFDVIPTLPPTTNAPQAPQADPAGHALLPHQLWLPRAVQGKGRMRERDKGIRGGPACPPPEKTEQPRSPLTQAIHLRLALLPGPPGWQLCARLAGDQVRRWWRERERERGEGRALAFLGVANLAKKGGGTALLVAPASRPVRASVSVRTWHQTPGQSRQDA